MGLVRFVGRDVLDTANDNEARQRTGDAVRGNELILVQL